MWCARIVSAVVIGLGVAHAHGGTLSASFESVPQGSTVNLSAEGKLDWVHWGLHTESSMTRKSDVEAQISNYRLIDTTNGFAFVYQYADNYNGYSWEDGYPAIAATNTPTGVWAYGTPALDSGFEITAPADATVRILKVYVGVFGGTGRLRAYLSDGSAAGYTNCPGIAPGPGCDALENFRNGPGRVYTIQYSADSPGQKLVVHWTLAALRDPTANVTLQAAALTTAEANNPPVVTLTSPANNAVFATGTTIECLASAHDLDGAVQRVEFWDGTNKLGEAASSPYTFLWNNAPVGYHRITAKAVDTDDASRTSLPIDVFVHQSGGALSGSISASPGFVDLTTEGSADWAHWGLVRLPEFDRKASVAPQIGDFTMVGTNSVVYFTNEHRFAWTDGTPHSMEAGTGTGIYVTGYTNGFTVTVPADKTPRQLKVYCGLYGAHGNFQAFLTDASAPAFTETSMDTVYDSYASVFTIDYAAASPGQKLVVRFRSANVYDMTYGNVALQSVTLRGPREEPVRIIDAQREGATFRLSFATELGRNYAVEFSEALSSGNWLAFTNFPGSGETITVHHENASSTQGYYRVTRQ